MAVFSSPETWLAANFGEALDNISFGDAINLTDGTWSLYDPDGLLNSISYDPVTEYHTVVWNALAVGSADYNWGSGANHRSPRWYKLAKINGVQLTTDDIVQAIFYAQVDNINRGDFDCQMVHGISVDPTSTTANTILGCGLIAQAWLSSANTHMGIWTVNSPNALAVVSPASDRCITTCQYGGLHVGGGSWTIVDSSGNRTNSGARSGNGVLPSATNLNWIVGVGPRINTTTIGAGNESQKFRIFRTAVKTDLGSVL